MGVPGKKFFKNVISNTAVFGAGNVWISKREREREREFLELGFKIKFNQSCKDTQLQKYERI